MTRIFISRHGRTAWHEEGRFAGTADIPLDEYGRRQAEMVASVLENEKFDCIFSSPLSRCLELARIVARGHGLEVEIEPRLKEIELGDWDGLTYGEILKRDGELIKMWTSDPTCVTVPGGESISDVFKRSMDWFYEVVNKYPEGQIFAVSHGGPIRAIIAGILEMPLSRMFRIGVDLASISIINFKGEFSYLETLNDTCHLSDIC